MKKFISLACAAMVGLSAFSQNESYNQVGISYSLSMYDFNYKGNDEPDPINGNGFAIKYIHGFSISQNLPMFIETGLNLSFNFGKNDADRKGYLETKSQFASISVPVNYAWKFNVGENMSVKPYLGLNLKFNMMGRRKTVYTDTFYDDFEKEHDMTYDEYVDYYEDRYGYEFDDESDDSWTNLYSTSDKDGVGSKDYTWNRVQLGWHIGADFQFRNFTIGLNYGTDFVPAWKYKKNKVNSSTFNIGVGYCF